MLRTYRTPNGLRITARNGARRELAEADGYPARESLVAEWLHERFEFLRPESIGALTDAPILGDSYAIERDENGELIHTGGPVWWFPDYAVRDPWEELKNTGRVIFKDS